MHERRDVPSINELLELVDWQAQASKLFTSGNTERKYPITKKKIKTKNSYQITLER